MDTFYNGITSSKLRICGQSAPAPMSGQIWTRALLEWAYLGTRLWPPMQNFPPGLGMQDFTCWLFLVERPRSDTQVAVTYFERCVSQSVFWTFLLELG